MAAASLISVNRSVPTARDLIVQHFVPAPPVQAERPEQPVRRAKSAAKRKEKR